MTVGATSIWGTDPDALARVRAVLGDTIGPEAVIVVVEEPVEPGGVRWSTDRDATLVISAREVRSGFAWVGRVEAALGLGKGSLPRPHPPGDVRTRLAARRPGSVSGWLLLLRPGAVAA